jgi:hypothetical protein
MKFFIGSFTEICQHILVFGEDRTTVVGTYMKTCTIFARENDCVGNSPGIHEDRNDPESLHHAYM